MRVRADLWDTNWLCQLFGHKVPEGWHGGIPYLMPDLDTVDALGTQHCSLNFRCTRCGERKTLAYFHLPPEWFGKAHWKPVPPAPDWERAPPVNLGIVVEGDSHLPPMFTGPWDSRRGSGK